MTDNFHGDFSTLTPEEQDAVINPKHYKILGPEVMALFLLKGMEYMDLMRYALARHNGVVSHVLGQVFKYSFRLGGKDDALQDATKIAWYGNRLVEEIEFERGLRKEKPRGDFQEGGGARVETLDPIEELVKDLRIGEAILEGLPDGSEDLDAAYVAVQEAIAFLEEYEKGKYEPSL